MDSSIEIFHHTLVQKVQELKISNLPFQHSAIFTTHISDNCFVLWLALYYSLVSLETIANKMVLIVYGKAGMAHHQGSVHPRPSGPDVLRLETYGEYDL